MNRIVGFIIFISIASLIYFSLHLFVYKFIKTALELSPNAGKYLKLFFWISGLSFFAGMLLSRLLHIHFLNYYAYIWMGIIAISFFVLLVTWTAVKFVPAHTRTLTLIALAVIGLITLISLFNGLQKPSVKNITVPIKKLPKELSGFTIVQISDLHMEIFKSKKLIPYIVNKVNDLKPDLVVITGDLIEDEVCKNSGFCRQLRRLKATHGVIAITGNHEFYAGIENFMKLTEKANINVLRNESITIAGGLQIIGLDDDDGRRMGAHGPDLDKAIKGCDPAKPMILLYHRPVRFDEAVKKGVDLQLSGHTHAGQIPPMDLIVSFYYKYPAGLYEKDGSYIYTSSGTGFWGPPMRFLSRNVITRITLIPKS
jgi:predicted MPP superfamily phosphohydrolase